MNSVLAGAATVCLATAFRHADAARLAPFEFTALVWAVALDLLLWGVLPAGMTLAGAAVVVFACLMSERAAAAAAAAAAVAVAARQGMPAGKT